MKIHHVGYLVDDIKAAAKEFLSLGFCDKNKINDINIIENKIIEDKAREIYILFLENNGHVVELIQPVSNMSPMYKLRKQYRNSPYHICFEADNANFEINKMLGEGYILLQPPTCAPAIDNREVVFLFNKHIGIIEFLI